MENSPKSQNPVEIGYLNDLRDSEIGRPLKEAKTGRRGCCRVAERPETAIPRGAMAPVSEGLRAVRAKGSKPPEP